MKLFACFAAVQAGIGDGAKQLTVFDEHVNCVNNDQTPSIDPSNAENYYAPSWLQGTYSCGGPFCELLTCSNGYQGVPVIPGSVKKMKCKHDRRTNTYSWNKDGLWSCKTCNKFHPLEHNDDFEVTCRFQFKGGYNLKVCNIECANGEKIFPLNKPKATNVMCKCNKRDGTCNWKKGSQIYDGGDHLDFSKWSCPRSHQIPDNLRCMKNNYSGESFVRNSDDRIVGGMEAQRNSWPWIVRLNIIREDGDEGSCGGTILDDKDSVLQVNLGKPLHVCFV